MKIATKEYKIKEKVPETLDELLELTDNFALGISYPDNIYFKRGFRQALLAVKGYGLCPPLDIKEGK